jgi:hypothetical protein
LAQDFFGSPELQDQTQNKSKFLIPEHAVFLPARSTEGTPSFSGGLTPLALLTGGQDELYIASHIFAHSFWVYPECCGPYFRFQHRKRAN